MSAAHTAGPWRQLPEEAGKDYIRIRGTVLGGRYKVANVPTPVYAGVPEHELAETRANACLITAAPDLLDVALWLEPWLSEHEAQEKAGGYQDDDSDRLVALRAAIAKATGEAA